MGNCLISSYDEANMSTIDLSSSSSSSSGPITAASTLSESTPTYSSCRNRQFSLSTTGSLVVEDRDPTPRMFQFSELKSATHGFNTENELGGFRKVYKGWIDVKPSVRSLSGSKIAVAIKKLNLQSVSGSGELRAEVNYLGSLSHPNIVKLLGYCWKDSELLLVYEYMQKGSLENHLFRRSDEPLSWDKRIKIALGVAHGLAFLHTDCRVTYRDFKTSRVLLDRKYRAKLSNFGLMAFGQSGVQLHDEGTNGYAAPEYVALGCLYVKSDVYGFGVVLLEILTGLRALDPNRPVEQQNLIEYTKTYSPA